MNALVWRGSRAILPWESRWTPGADLLCEPVAECVLLLCDLAPECELPLCDPLAECEPLLCELVAECVDEWEPDELRPNTPGAVQATTVANASAANRMAPPICGSSGNRALSRTSDPCARSIGGGNPLAG